MASRELILIQTPYIEDYGPMRKAAGTYFPLGLGYIAASVRAAGFKASLLDPNVQELPPEAIAETVRRRSPLLVGVSFMTPQFDRAHAICRAIAERSPDTPIILGGAHPSVLPEQTLRHIPEASYLAVGEAEGLVVELLKVLAAGQRNVRLPGLARSEGGNVIYDGTVSTIQDLDALPYPDRSLVNQSLYRPQSFLSHYQRVGTIYTSRGCPGRCVFCASGHRLRAPIRERSLDSVMDEIAQIRQDHGIEYLLIKDDTFTMRRSRVEEFCRRIGREQPGLKWHCMGRVNTIDESLLRMMKQAGLHDIFLGIESGDDSILRRARKGITTTAAQKAVEACCRAGVRSYGAFIIGLPGETPETAEATIRFACSLPLTMAGFSVLIPYPGTQVYEEHYAEGPNGQAEFSEFIASTGTHYAKGYSGLGEGLDVCELPALVAEGQKRFYMRPRQVLRMLHHAGPSMVRGYWRGFRALVEKSRYLRQRNQQA